MQSSNAFSNSAVYTLYRCVFGLIYVVAGTYFTFHQSICPGSDTGNGPKCSYATQRS